MLKGVRSAYEIQRETDEQRESTEEAITIFGNQSLLQTNTNQPQTSTPTTTSLKQN